MDLLGHQISFVLLFIPSDMAKSGNVDGDNSTTVKRGYLIDYIDGKIRKETPEEYVRQETEKSLINEYGYYRKQCSVEFTIKMGSTKPRVDITIHHENEQKTQESAYIMIECKAPTLSLIHI